MSGISAQMQQQSQPAGQIIADLDRLFSEQGIAINGDGDTLVLTADGHHTVKYHRPQDPPQPTPNARKALPQLRFEGGEHTAIGDSTLLRFVKDGPAIPAWQVELHLPNGLALTYGQVVALGGDFYGIPEQPICEGATAAERVQRFNAAFNSLAVLPASRDEARQILAVMQKEVLAANQAIRDGKQPHEAYDALGDTLSEEWNRITGGGSVVSALFPLGRYLKLAANNADHFGEWALAAYVAGHTAALQQAALAGKTADDKQLELAYAMNAFADHFLTDLFSAGHVRVPRKQLAAVVTPSDLGSLITRFMHDEDSKFGLNVSNALGERWHAYGDKRYFDSVDQRNRQQVKQAVQRSADEIFACYLSGQLPAAGSYGALQALPDLNAAKTGNFSPLFVMSGDKVLRRSDVNNLNDSKTIDNWWGWSTYLLLKNYSPNKPAGYLDTPSAVPTILVDGWQSHTPSAPNWLPGQAVRYALSETNGLNESYIGPWSAYVELSDSFQPTLDIPPGTSNSSATGRNVFRQFRAGSPELIGSIDKNTSRFIDRNA
ncbi:phospholipase [Pseudomonas protegens]|uniref:Phospholipase n=1 Tax=Pseudomonas protegens TaxID=380021 RepID=A0A7G8YV39_9PSED|nr:phospholipase [Pseudomonas protegens]QNH79536.1 phospholipase [Pseudomonas protegens]QNL08733.1 phospholipase [Pseudomonas protegens]